MLRCCRRKGDPRYNHSQKAPAKGATWRCCCSGLPPHLCLQSGVVLCCECRHMAALAHRPHASLCGHAGRGVVIGLGAGGVLDGDPWAAQGINANVSGQRSGSGGLFDAVFGPATTSQALGSQRTRPPERRRRLGTTTNVAAAAAAAAASAAAAKLPSCPMGKIGAISTPSTCFFSTCAYQTRV